MNTAPQPAKDDIEELLSYLPKLYSQDSGPTATWGKASEGQDGVITMGYPIYTEVVRKFFDTASKDCWNCKGYDSRRVREMLEDEKALGNAGMDQIREVLTYCVRGERFCDGHWEAMIKEGHIRRILERLGELKG